MVHNPHNAHKECAKIYLYIPLITGGVDRYDIRRFQGGMMDAAIETFLNKAEN